MRAELRRLLKQARVDVRTEDPRLKWERWPDKNRHVVLAIVDYCDAYAHDFPRYGGPATAPGFDCLPPMGQTLLLDLWALWGTSRRFPGLVAGLIQWEQEIVVCTWWLRSHIQRARLRRKFGTLWHRFDRDGAATYSSHFTYRRDRWPERATWTREERDYIALREFQWSESRFEWDADTKWFRDKRGRNLPCIHGRKDERWSAAERQVAA